MHFTITIHTYYSSQVGDPLELRFEIFDERSPYEIFVRDLLAKDGNDQNQVNDCNVGNRTV